MVKTYFCKIPARNDLRSSLDGRHVYVDIQKLIQDSRPPQSAAVGYSKLSRRIGMINLTGPPPFPCMCYHQRLDKWRYISWSDAASLFVCVRALMLFS